MSKPSWTLHQFRLASTALGQTTEADCVLQSVLVLEAAAAIPAMTGRKQLICEAPHWRYCCRYRPQLAKMAHGMAGGGSRDDFKTPEFVQKWSCSIFYALNMDPQVSGIQDPSAAGVLYLYLYSLVSFHSLHLESNQPQVGL
jgi:hypothetical protein